MKPSRKLPAIIKQNYEQLCQHFNGYATEEDIQKGLYQISWYINHNAPAILDKSHEDLTNHLLAFLWEKLPLFNPRKSPSSNAPFSTFVKAWVIPEAANYKRQNYNQLTKLESKSSKLVYNNRLKFTNKHGLDKDIPLPDEMAQRFCQQHFYMLKGKKIFISLERYREVELLILTYTSPEYSDEVLNPEIEQSPSFNPESTTFVDEVHEIIEAILQKITPHSQASTLYDRHFADKTSTLQELAAKKGVSNQAINNLEKKGMKKFSNLLHEYQINEEELAFYLANKTKTITPPKAHIIA